MNSTFVNRLQEVAKELGLENILEDLSSGMSNSIDTMGGSMGSMGSMGSTGVSMGTSTATASPSADDPNAELDNDIENHPEVVQAKTNALTDIQKKIEAQKAETDKRLQIQRAKLNAHSAGSYNRNMAG